MRISTWNMAYWTHKPKHEEAWKYLLGELSPDVALVQESKPAKSIQNCVWKTIGGARDWGSGVVSKNMPIDEIESPKEFPNAYPGSLIGARVELPDGKKLHAFSLYGLFEKDIYSKHNETSASLHRMLSDLTFILLHLQNKKQYIIIGGDFNNSIQFDELWKPKYCPNACRIFFDRLKDFGFFSVCETFYKEPVQTLRKSGSSVPWQNDHIFVSNNLRKHLRSCQVLDNEKVRSFSDHNPVMIELDLSE